MSNVISMKQANVECAPFTGRLLTDDSQKTDLPSLLPASRRTEDDDLECLAANYQPTDILEWVNKEFNVDRLKDIHDWLWIVVHERALGFLFSYVALIMHESDFYVTKELHLIPEKVHCPAWRVAVRQLLDGPSIYSRIDPRFHYGELRLSRLNKIYFFWQKPLCGYTSRWNQYGSFFHDNFVLLASSTVYIAVVLTAMQVGLATEALQGNEAFQSASYGFTVFSIVGPLAAAVLVVAVFCYLFTGNWVATGHYSRERLKRIQGR
ncbi:hypothetical protein CSAL01_11658 [Colletotrichum salicis]|uniref:Uncharacterized protein n=1 Tax=Colletotrichum salicis TaxID=1209931 RepID=A0A135UGY1_9PEZI|nr:hypothetical protein CSAL01_11658 [Colletotrichum salicis]